MTALDRLYAEAVPDGTFGGARPTPTRCSLPRDLQVTSAEEAAMRQRVLAREVAAYDEAHRGRRPRTCHLRPVPDPPSVATAIQEVA